MASRGSVFQLRPSGEYEGMPCGVPFGNSMWSGVSNFVINAPLEARRAVTSIAIEPNAKFAVIDGTPFGESTTGSGCTVTIVRSEKSVPGHETDAEPSAAMIAPPTPPLLVLLTSGAVPALTTVGLAGGE